MKNIVVAFLGDPAQEANLRMEDFYTINIKKPTNALQTVLFAQIYSFYSDHHTTHHRLLLQWTGFFGQMQILHWIFSTLMAKSGYLH